MSVDAVLADRARSLSMGVVAEHARTVDQESRFPAENLAALHEAELMAVFLPRGLGGHDASVQTYAAITAILAEQCASTAMLWAMHGQQLVSLYDHAATSHSEWLERVATDGCIIGSVTTDAKGGADLFTTGDALVPESAGLRVRRFAPVVTAGSHAGFYLVTMRADPEAPPNRTSLVCVAHGDGVIEECGDWRALGMRGTHSVPMRFDVLVPPSRVVPVPFSDIAKVTMVPVGHVGWASCWLGAARGAANRVREALRKRTLTRSSAISEVLYARLAEVRLYHDLLESIIGRVAAEADQVRQHRRSGAAQEYVDPVLANNVKLAGSRLAFAAVDLLVETVGMRDGYLCDSDLGLERTLRDLRSASLMFHNDRLLQSNGRLVLAGGRGLIGLADRGGHGDAPVTREDTRAGAADQAAGAAGA